MERLLKIAIDAALEAGREIMRVYDDPIQDFDIEMKSDRSPLTRADRAAHKCIVSSLTPTGIPILSEEGELPPYDERREWHRFWLVDPLDGTKEFIRRNGEFTVNIALIEDGRPVLGIIYVPSTTVLYGGIVGLGARRIEGIRARTHGVAAKRAGRDQKPITFQSLPLPCAQDRPPGLVVVASRSHLSDETAEYIHALRMEDSSLRLVSKGSSLKMCLVAEGSADLYPRFAPTMEWDTAAGDAIVRAAGMKVVDFRTGEPLTYNKPDLHNPWFIVKGRKAG